MVPAVKYQCTEMDLGLDDDASAEPLLESALFHGHLDATAEALSDFGALDNHDDPGGLLEGIAGIIDYGDVKLGYSRDVYPQNGNVHSSDLQEDPVTATVQDAPPRQLAARDSRILFLVMLLFELEQESRGDERAAREALREREQFEFYHRTQLATLEVSFANQMDDSHEQDLEDEHRRTTMLQTAVAAGASISTLHSVERAVWTRVRSQAWWDECRHPEFPPEAFQALFHISRPAFDLLCYEVGPDIGKVDTIFRAAVPVPQRVAVCIWRLATGEALRLVARRFGLGISTCHHCVTDVLAAINNRLLSRYLKWPEGERALEVMSDFEQHTGIPNLIGAVYTMHIPINAPRINLGSYYNKRLTERNKGKTSYSVTIQGTTDSKGCFTDVCIGWPGSLTDDQILRNSALMQRGGSGGMGAARVAGTVNVPLFPWLLVPYVGGEELSWVQLHYNEKVLEAGRVAKDAFLRLKGRWTFLAKRTEIRIQEWPATLGACCVLHNLCERMDGPINPDWVAEVYDDEVVAGGEDGWSREALETRDAIALSIYPTAHEWGQVQEEGEEGEEEEEEGLLGHGGEGLEIEQLHGDEGHMGEEVNLEVEEEEEEEGMSLGDGDPEDDLMDDSGSLDYGGDDHG